jgi:hypothetical protein
VSIELPTELTNLLNAQTMLIVAVVGLAVLMALVLMQAGGLRRRMDDMLQEDAAAHATLRTAAERVARIEAGTLPTGHEDLRVAVSPDLSERLEESARRGGVSLMTAARAALERGLAEERRLAAEQAELRQPREIAAGAMAVEPIADRPRAGERNGH